MPDHQCPNAGDETVAASAASIIRYRRLTHADTPQPLLLRAHPPQHVPLLRMRPGDRCAISNAILTCVCERTAAARASCVVHRQCSSLGKAKAGYGSSMRAERGKVWPISAAERLEWAGRWATMSKECRPTRAETRPKSASTPVQCSIMTPRRRSPRSIAMRRRSNSTQPLDYWEPCPDL